MTALKVSHLVFLITIVVHCLVFSNCDDNNVGNARRNAENVPYPYHLENLPRTIVPDKYKIYLRVDLEKHFGFCGEVIIDLNCVDSTRYVILHSKDLAITHYSLYDIQDSLRKLDFAYPMKEHLQYEQILFETKEELVSGKSYRLFVTFKGSGIVKNKRELQEPGILRDSYKIDGKERHIGYTILAPEFARKIFPCFDEPDFKASFVLTIAHDKDLNAVSNTPLVKRVSRNSYLDESTFEPTVNMSTYLVMFAVNDFERVSTTTPRGTKIIVWARKSVIKDVQPVLRPVVSFVTYYENYTGINYPYKELNIMSILQHDPVAPAFEGFGLTVAKENFLNLKNKNKEDEDLKLNRKIAITHEIAHMWFGGLVTIKGWNEAWIYQGMAHFFAFNALMQYNSTFRENTIVCIAKRWGLRHEEFEETLPLNPERKWKFKELADSVHFHTIFNKGASMFYMLQKLIGKEALKKGIRIYMKKYRFRNANANDLWEALQSAGRISFDIKTFMHGWEYQAGFPLINIKYAGRHSNGSKIYSLTQSRFVEGLDEKDPKYQKKYKGLKWQIPVWYSDSSSPLKTKFIWMNDTSVNIIVPGCVKWIKVNSGEAGFYRVNYTQDMWDNLTAQFNDYHEVFREEDRFGLLSDVWRFVWAKPNASIINALKMSTYLSRETKSCPMRVVDYNLHGFGKMFRYRPVIFDKFKEYMQGLFVQSRWNDRQFESNLYVIRFNMMAYYEEESHIKECLGYINQWMYSKRNKLFGNKLFSLRQIVYETAVRFGNESHWEFLRNQIDNLTESEEDKKEKTRLEEGLASTKSGTLMNRWLNESFDEKNENKTDIFGKLTKLSKYNPGRELVWIYFKTNYDRIIERDAQINGNKTESFLGFTKYFDDQCGLEEVERFARSKEKLWSSPATNSSLATIRSNIKWIQRHEKPLNDFLTEHVKKIQ